MQVLIDIAISFLKKHWNVIALVLCAIVIFLLFNWGNSWKKTAKIEAKSKNEAIRSDNEKARLINLTDDELEKALTEKLELKWVLDSLKKNPKVVKEIHYIKSIKEVKDTVRIVRTINVKDTTLSSTFENCGVMAKFTWAEGDTAGEWEVKDKTSLAIIGINERRKLWGVNFFPRWGRMEYSVHVLNQCQDSIITNYKLTRQ